MEKKKTSTKLNENVFTTKSIEEMRGKYLVKDLFRKWNEPHIDEDTGEIIEVERTEVVLKRGTLLGVDQLAVISFHIAAGDITEVTCSDQKRLGTLSQGWSLNPWCVTVQLAKKHKFLLLARNIFQAMEIVTDYCEQKYDISFSITSAKEFKQHIFIEDDTVRLVMKEGVEVPEDEAENIIRAFYSVDATITFDENDSRDFRFLVYAKEVDDAKMHIEKHIREKLDKEADANFLGVADTYIAQTKLKIVVTSAKKINCSVVIGFDFTQAYNRKEDGDN